MITSESNCKDRKAVSATEAGAKSASGNVNAISLKNISRPAACSNIRKFSSLYSSEKRCKRAKNIQNYYGNAGVFKSPPGECTAEAPGNSSYNSYFKIKRSVSQRKMKDNFLFDEVSSLSNSVSVRNVSIVNAGSTLPASNLETDDEVMVEKDDDTFGEPEIVVNQDMSPKSNILLYENFSSYMLDKFEKYASNELTAIFGKIGDREDSNTKFIKENVSKLIKRKSYSEELLKEPAENYAGTFTKSQLGDALNFSASQNFAYTPSSPAAASNNSSSSNNIFGKSLKENAYLYGSALPPVVCYIINFISANCFSQMGIFRKNGNKGRINDLIKKASANPNASSKNDIDLSIYNHYDLADFIKSYIREVPGTVLTLKFVEILKLIFTKKRTLAEAAELFNLALAVLPDENRIALYRIMRMLKVIELNNQTNQMTSKNIAICVSPSLFTVVNDISLYVSKLTGFVSPPLAIIKINETTNSAGARTDDFKKPLKSSPSTELEQVAKQSVNSSSSPQDRDNSLLMMSSHATSSANNSFLSFAERISSNKSEKNSATSANDFADKSFKNLIDKYGLKKNAGPYSGNTVKKLKTNMSVSSTRGMGKTSFDKLCDRVRVLSKIVLPGSCPVEENQEIENFENMKMVGVDSKFSFKSGDVNAQRASNITICQYITEFMLDYFQLLFCVVPADDLADLTMDNFKSNSDLWRSIDRAVEPSITIQIDTVDRDTSNNNLAVADQKSDSKNESKAKRPVKQVELPKDLNTDLKVHFCRNNDEISNMAYENDQKYKNYDVFVQMYKFTILYRQNYNLYPSLYTFKTSLTLSVDAADLKDHLMKNTKEICGFAIRKTLVLLRVNAENDLVYHSLESTDGAEESHLLLARTCKVDDASKDIIICMHSVEPFKELAECCGKSKEAQEAVGKAGSGRSMNIVQMQYHIEGVQPSQRKKSLSVSQSVDLGTNASLKHSKLHFFLRVDLQGRKSDYYNLVSPILIIKHLNCIKKNFL